MKKTFAGIAAGTALGIALSFGAAAPAQAAVPRQYANALATAQSYVKILDISKKGLYDQLTSKYGSKFPKAAANYALKHVKVNYNKEALGAARAYDKLLHLSDDGLFDQLTSEYGSKFTASQARYAIKHL